MESQPDSLVYFVRTHLYRKLERDGVNFILDWSTSKDIDVLDKNDIYSHSLKSALVFHGHH
jgi:hypothetical protein